MRPPTPQEMRTKITIERLTAGTWSTLLTVWARVSPTGGNLESDVRGTGQSSSETQQTSLSSEQFEFWTHYQSQITAVDRILWNSRELYLTAPPENFDILNRWTILRAELVTEAAF